jgi:hypothetical protein
MAQVNQPNSKPMARPAAGDEKNESNDDQGRPVKVNASSADKPSRDLQKPHEYQTDAGRKDQPASPVMDDEDLDLDTVTDAKDSLAPQEVIPSRNAKQRQWDAEAYHQVRHLRI